MHHVPLKGHTMLVPSFNKIYSGLGTSISKPVANRNSSLSHIFLNYLFASWMDLQSQVTMVTIAMTTGCPVQSNISLALSRRNFSWAMMG